MASRDGRGMQHKQGRQGEGQLAASLNNPAQRKLAGCMSKRFATEATRRADVLGQCALVLHPPTSLCATVGYSCKPTCCTPTATPPEGSACLCTRTLLAFRSAFLSAFFSFLSALAAFLTALRWRKGSLSCSPRLGALSVRLSVPSASSWSASSKPLHADLRLGSGYCTMYGMAPQVPASMWKSWEMARVTSTHRCWQTKDTGFASMMVHGCWQERLTFDAACHQRRLASPRSAECRYLHPPARLCNMMTLLLRCTTDA